MNENEVRLKTTADKKQKIRERYKGIDSDKLDVIPAVPVEDIFSLTASKRVAIYARVSTDDPGQTSSYELQKNHYTDMIKSYPNWNLVDIYADEGISGTSLQHRDSFMRMISDCERGIFLTPPLLGYDHDEDGNLVINEDEAKIVRLIFFMYLYGYSCPIIAETLTQYGCKTKKGNTSWSSGSILQILQNERHCGDVLARKTYTPNFLDHKSKKNKKNRNQYRQTGHHESIVSRDDFIAVQHLINNAKYGNKGILPSLYVVKEGSLLGFVSINPRWAGFKPEEYIQNNITALEGDFDLGGYEIA